jgi:hypothetical protein
MFVDGLWDPQSDSAVHYKSPSLSPGNVDNGASDQMWLTVWNQMNWML